jgi:hypothetical protein
MDFVCFFMHVGIGIKYFKTADYLRITLLKYSVLSHITLFFMEKM